MENVFQPAHEERGGGVLTMIGGVAAGGFSGGGGGGKFVSIKPYCSKQYSAVGRAASGASVADLPDGRKEPRRDERGDASPRLKAQTCLRSPGSGAREGVFANEQIARTKSDWTFDQ